MKRWLLGAPFSCFAQCPAGLERILADELTDLRIGEVVDVELGGVSALLSPVEIARANLELRSATRVLLRLDEFYAGSSEALFDHVRRVPWEVQLGLGGEYRLSVTSRLSKLQAGNAVERTISLGIARRLAELGLGLDAAAGEDPYPSSVASAPDVLPTPELSFRFYNDRCYVSLNTSGEPLHRRGVRRHVGEAPLRESLAAALALSGYRGQGVVLDPFCGSGTVLIEASDLIAGRLPGRDRDFTFKHLPWFRPGMWNEALRRADAARRPPRAARVIGCDIDRVTLKAARRNLSSSQLADIELLEADSAQIDLDRFIPSSFLPGASSSGQPDPTAAEPAGTDLSARGLLLSNLPYGVRLADRSATSKVIAAFLERCEAASTEWDFVFLTQHSELLRGRARTVVTDTTVVNNGGLRVHMVSGTTGVA